MGADLPRTIEPADPQTLEQRLREIIAHLFPASGVDALELRHLARVVTECSLLLTDVYSAERLARILYPERAVLTALLERVLGRGAEAGALWRLRRLPDDVRLVGDKALFDVAILGLRSVKGLDLEDLGPRAYRIASETLELLAEDRRLREFFKQNRLVVLPLEEEVSFLRQCSQRFAVYAEILKHLHDAPARLREELRVQVPLMAAAAEALAGEPDSPEADAYLRAAAPAQGRTDLARDDLISFYERQVLFASLDLDRLRDALRRVVVDQDEAVDRLCDAFVLFAAGTADRDRPPAYFLAGPTGVGKNRLVESLKRALETLWGIEIPMLTLEGPSYTYPSDVHDLRGATRGFIRSDEEGLLSTFYARASKSPLSILLVDEVEKAHPQLRRFFLSILDRGTVMDNRGRVLHFPNTLIFFTSNLGYSDAHHATAPIGYQDPQTRLRRMDDDVRRVFKRALAPEFVNRVQIIHFRRLTQESAARILELELERIRARYRSLHGVELQLTPAARQEVLRRGFSWHYGARHLAAVLERICNVEVAKRLRADDRGGIVDRRALLEGLRAMREGRRAFCEEDLARSVSEAMRVRVGYRKLNVDFRDGQFLYEPVAEGAR